MLGGGCGGGGKVTSVCSGTFLNDITPYKTKVNMYLTICAIQFLRIFLMFQTHKDILSL